MGHGKSHLSRVRRASRPTPGNDLGGAANTACLTFARQAWGVSRAQGYRLLKKAWAQIKDDIDESGIDRQELLSWSIKTLMAAAEQIPHLIYDSARKSPDVVGAFTDLGRVISYRSSQHKYV